MYFRISFGLSVLVRKNIKKQKEHKFEKTICSSARNNIIVYSYIIIIYLVVFEKTKGIYITHVFNV